MPFSTLRHNDESKDWIWKLIFRKGFQSNPPDPQHDLDPDQDPQK